ncbi:MAG TPA: hypothetical protein VK595_07165 [Vicinamibacterales bacterium]|nr:hypothetical protein [Vicinamibacterales bacterium]
MNNYLRAAKEELIKDAAQEFGSAGSDMAGWHGVAADAFRDDFLNPLQDGVGLLVDRIDTLAMILEAHQELVRSMRHDVMELVKHTLDGIAAAESDGWEVGMQIVGAVVSVAGAVVASVGTGGTAGVVLGPIAATMIAGGIGVAVQAQSADSELGVIVEFVNSGEDLIDRINIESARIEGGFRDLAASITGEKLPEVRPERPLLITAPDFRPETFGLSDQVQGSHPVPTDTTDVVPEPTKHPDGPFDRTKGGKDRYPEQGPA